MSLIRTVLYRELIVEEKTLGVDIRTSLPLSVYARPEPWGSPLASRPDHL